MMSDVKYTKGNCYECGGSIEYPFDVTNLKVNIMKRKVLIEMEIDPLDYFACKDSTSGITELVTAMIHGEADFPDTVKITVETLTK